MDFRVTHFLVAASAQTDGVTSTLQALSNGRIACYPATANSATSAVVTNQTTPFFFAQGLDSTDAIQKELGVIKSGIINPSKVVSVRKVVGTVAYTRLVKFFGGAPTVASDDIVFPLADSSTTLKPTAIIEGDKEYSLSVRALSAKANSISPFGLTRGYSTVAENTYNGVTHAWYGVFSAAFNIVRNFALDPMLKEFVKVSAFISFADDTATPVVTNYYLTSGTTMTMGNSQTVTVKNVLADGIETWKDSVAAAFPSLSVMPSANVIAGSNYVLTFVVEALTQTNWANAYDITAFPYRWDSVRPFAFLHQGPYGTGTINASISTQTPTLADTTYSGSITTKTIVITDPTLAANDVVDSSALKFPNLLKEEVRHIAHQYQSYSLKYKQQFHGVKYNAMVMDPQQAKIDAAGPYTLYYIEYMPDVDVAYTSTQPMTNLTILAVPSASTDLISDLDTILTGETTETAS